MWLNDGLWLRIDKKLQVFPNPAIDEVSIIVKLDKNEKGNIKVMDMQGNILNNYTIDINKNTLKVETKSLSSGVYFIKYSSVTGKEKIEKLIITK